MTPRVLTLQERHGHVCMSDRSQEKLATGCVKYSDMEGDAYDPGAVQVATDSSQYIPSCSFLAHIINVVSFSFPCNTSCTRRLEGGKEVDPLEYEVTGTSTT